MDPKEFQNEQPPTIIPPQMTPEGDYNPAHKNHVSPVRSYSTDLANAIREKGGSVVRIAIAEDEKHKREIEESSATSRKNLFFIGATVLIVVAGLAAIAIAYKHKKDAAVVAPTSNTLPDAIVSTEGFQQIDFTGMQLVESYAAINAIADKPGIEDGTIKNIVITKSMGGIISRMSANQLISGLGMHAPGELLLALNKEYMMGVYARNGGHLFLILKGSAHDFLLSGMLAWEQKLFNDMVPLFNIDTSTLTPTQLQSMPFSDTVIENRDTRAAIDKNGKTLLFYSFLDQDNIIIATDAKTLTEIVRRF